LDKDNRRLNYENFQPPIAFKPTLSGCNKDKHTQPARAPGACKIVAFFWVLSVYFFYPAVVKKAFGPTRNCLGIPINLKGGSIIIFKRLPYKIKTTGPEKKC